MSKKQYFVTIEIFYIFPLIYVFEKWRRITDRLNLIRFLKVQYSLERKM